MGEHYLQRKPHKVRGDNEAWWYEEPQGISVVVSYERFKVFCTKEVKIPWRSLEYALKRKRKPNA
jgi:hypothetical protein